MLIDLHDIVRRYNLQISGVLHVGAHEGEENSAYLSNGVNQQSIYWVEANPSLCERLSTRLPNVIQAAVSDKIEKVTFHVTNNYQSSAILELEEHRNEHPHIHVMQTLELETKTIDSVVEAHSISANFLNMDIQGAELKCLQGFEKHIGMIDYIYTEVNTKHLYKGCALLDELDEWLSARGFERRELRMTEHGWGDALYIRKPRMRWLLVDTNIHNKNKIGFILMCEKANIEYTISNSSDVFRQNWDMVYIPSSYIEPSAFPNASKIVYGPHNFVLVEGLWKKGNHKFPTNCYYNVLSEWVNTLYEEVGGLSLSPKVLPFPVDVDKFAPSLEEKTLDCFVYFKRRHSSEIEFVVQELERKGLNYKVITYGSYSEDEFIDTIRKSKFGIWIGTHESQGFALEETLACNTPLLVWNSTSMFDERSMDAQVYGQYRGIYKLNATSHPYWDESCGISFSAKDQFPDNLTRMLESYQQFQPRNYIESVLSPTACAERFVQELNLGKQDVFMITNVVNTGQKPWSYAVRSVYSPEERFQQAVHTIQTIRTKAPRSKILFVECSDLSKQQNAELTSLVDYFVNLSSIEEVRDACLNSEKKGFGEAFQTKYGIEFLFKKRIEFDRLFKISGRYALNSGFSLGNFSMDEFTFKKSANPSSISTVLFSVPYCHLFTFYNTICNTVDFYKTHGPTGYETIVPQQCHPRKQIDVVGAEGYVAVNRGELITA